MYLAASSPIKDVPFGDALTISLNNYYDLLKSQAGSLASEERLQLKLTADPFDISEDNYKWFSYYNLLRRSDRAIEPVPLSGTVLTGVASLASVYERFLRRLRSFVVIRELSPDEQKRIAEIDLTLDRKRDKARDLAVEEIEDWKLWCEIKGWDPGDTALYVQWSAQFGRMRDIEELAREMNLLYFERKTLLDRNYSKTDDREVIDAEALFYNPAVRLRYPIHPDYEYGNGEHFSAEYLASLPLGSTALFDDRRVATWDKTLGTIKNAAVGTLQAVFDRSTAESTSITTDWKYSGSMGYAFIKVRVNASSHTKITEDFAKATKLTLSAAAAQRVNIDFGPWFRETLFTHRIVQENPEAFEEFFGENGSLLYYPTALIVVRGFGIEFESAQEWQYDYEHSFRASAGGGFSVFGINFGSSKSYSKHTKEHKIDRSTTKLRIMDDPSTVRFVGYAVKRNAFFGDLVQKSRVAVAAAAGGQ